jgi:hypothetical protein
VNVWSVFSDAAVNVRGKVIGIYGLLISANIAAWAWALIAFLALDVTHPENSRFRRVVNQRVKARGELVARITGHGAGLRRWILFTVCRDLAVHLGRAVPCKRAAGGVRNQRRP